MATLLGKFRLLHGVRSFGEGGTYYVPAHWGGILRRGEYTRTTPVDMPVP